MTARVPGDRETTNGAGFPVLLPVALFLLSGDICPTCGYGTRKTSANWGRCKRCHQRVARRPMDEAAKKLKAVLT